MTGFLIGLGVGLVLGIPGGWYLNRRFGKKVDAVATAVREG